jgi:hypothetical protein
VVITRINALLFDNRPFLPGQSQPVTRPQRRIPAAFHPNLNKNRVRQSLIQYIPGTLLFALRSKDTHTDHIAKKLC